MKAIDITKSRKELEEITAEQAKQINAIYEDSLKTVQGKLASLKGIDTATASLQRARLTELEADLTRSVSASSAKLESLVTGNMSKVARSVVEDNLAFLSKAGFEVKGCLAHVPRDVVSSIATGKVYTGDWTLSKAIWSNDAKIKNDIQSVIASGIAQNKSSYEIAKDLEKYVDPSAAKDWAWNKVYPGTSARVDYNAQRLARTMTSHAYQQSLVMNVKDNPFVTGIPWKSAHAAGRTCELCEQRDGQIFDKEELPLDHPNGICTWIPVMEDDYEKIADRISKWEPDSGNDPELDSFAESLKGGNKEAIVKPKNPIVRNASGLTKRQEDLRAQAQKTVDEANAKLNGKLTPQKRAALEQKRDKAQAEVDKLNAISNKQLGITPVTKIDPRKEFVDKVNNLPGSSFSGRPVASTPENPSTFASITFDKLDDKLVRQMDDDIEALGMNIHEGGIKLQVDVNSLKATGNSVDRKRIIKMFDDDLAGIKPNEEFIVCRFNGENVILDDSARAMVSKLRGDATIEARVFDVDVKKAKDLKKQIVDFEVKADDAEKKLAKLQSSILRRQELDKIDDFVNQADELRAKLNIMGVNADDLDVEIKKAIEEKAEKEAQKAAAKAGKTAFDPKNYPEATHKQMVKYSKKNKLLLSAEDEETCDLYYQTGNSFRMNEVLYTGKYDRYKAGTLSVSERRQVDGYIQDIDDFTKLLNGKKLQTNCQLVRFTDKGELKTILNSCGLDEDVLLKKSAPELTAALKGTEYTTKSFMSTSYDVSQNVFSNRPVQIRIYADKGANAMLSPNISGWSEEYVTEAEVAFNRGSRFQIIGFEQIGNRVLQMKIRTIV